MLLSFPEFVKGGFENGIGFDKLTLTINKLTLTIYFDPAFIFTKSMIFFISSAVTFLPALPQLVLS